MDRQGHSRSQSMVTERRFSLTPSMLSRASMARHSRNASTVTNSRGSVRYSLTPSALKESRHSRSASTVTQRGHSRTPSMLNRFVAPPALLRLQPGILDLIIDSLSTEDIKNLLLTCRVLAYSLRRHLWGHVHIKTINCRSQFTDTDLRPYQGECHPMRCGGAGSTYLYEHACCKRYIRVDESNLADICSDLMSGKYADAFSHVRYLTVTLPLLFPEPTKVPVTRSEMYRVDFGSLVHWFVEQLNPQSFLDLERLEIVAIELGGDDLTSPLAYDLVDKFNQVGKKAALLVSAQENWLVRQPVSRNLVQDNVTLLTVECNEFDDALALSNGRSLPPWIERFELRTAAGQYSAEDMAYYLSRCCSLRELTIYGDVVNPRGVQWLPETVESLTLFEYGTLMQPQLYCSAPTLAAMVTTLRVGINNATVFQQLHLPNLRRLWITSFIPQWTDDHFRSVLCMLTTCNKIKELRFQGVPYELVARLLSIANIDTVEALIVEYLGVDLRGFSPKSTRRGAQLIARECPKLKFLFIDLMLPKFKRVVEVVKEFVRFCPHLETIMGNMLVTRPEWISLYSGQTVWTGYSHMALNGYPLVVDKPLFVSCYDDGAQEAAINTSDSSIAAALIYSRLVVAE